jgi:2'-5' RNA ligase
MTNPAQFDLLAADEAAPPFKLDAVRGKAKSYTLFLALVPEPEQRPPILSLANDLRAMHALRGDCLAADRLHITLHAVAHFRDEVPQHVVDAAVAAAGRVSCPSFAVGFDQARSFPHSEAFVLLCDTGSNAAIKHLRQLLTLELRRFELHPTATETPHMTLLYDKRKVEAHPVEPLSWTAKRFALILSHVGAGHHQRIADWPLR